MVLKTAVKEFIETYIEDIESENMYYVFSRSLDYLNDSDFDQLYRLLEKLPLKYDLDEPIYDIIRDLCYDIKRQNNNEYICIEDEWDKIGFNYLNNKERIIDQFEKFDIELHNGKHYCKVYDD